MITIKDLEAQVRRLNLITNSPLESYRKVNGRLTANVGNYHLDGAYGGYKLARIATEGGATDDVLRSGYCTKRELSELIRAFETGLHISKAIAL